MTINGEEVEVHYGDKVVPLKDRLDALDSEVRWLRRALVTILVALTIHAALPNVDILQLILGYFMP